MPDPILDGWFIIHNSQLGISKTQTTELAKELRNPSSEISHKLPPWLYILLVLVVGENKAPLQYQIQPCSWGKSAAFLFSHQERADHNVTASMEGPAMRHTGQIGTLLMSMATKYLVWWTMKAPCMQTHKFCLFRASSW